jgi:hypothetical protein
MKKILITSLLTAAITVPVVFAEENINVPFSPVLSSVTPVTESVDPVNSLNARKIQTKERAAVLINERVQALQGNKTAIEKNNKLTVEQKTLLIASLTTTIANLTTLKASVASSTDATTTKALTESIFKDHRIYGIVIPKVRLESRIYQLKNHTTTLSERFTKIQTKIDEHKAKGNDIMAWQKNLDDAKALVAQNMFKLDELLKKTAALTPASYGTTSKTIIDSVSSDMRVISKDLNTVVSKVRKPEISKKERSAEKMKERATEKQMLMGTANTTTTPR